MSDHNVMEVASSAMRGCIVAAPGKKLCVADLSNIEGRTQAWSAGEAWKVQAFRDFDTIGADGKRKGHDLYKLAYAKAFGIKPEDVTKDQRQKGKVMELALGYQGGVGAFVTFALAYGIDLDSMADDAWDALPADLVEEADSFLSWLHSKVHDASKKRVKKIAAQHMAILNAGQHTREEVAQLERAAMTTENARLAAELDKAQYGLTRKVFIVCDVFKRAWRLAHPNIVAMWKELEQGVVMATNRPGMVYKVGPLSIRRDGMWLRIRLPSGFFLCYPSPKVDEDGKWSYMGVDQYTRKWKRISSYGGKIFENCLAEGTKVLTQRGMVPIEQVRVEDKVWDGIEWVTHKGCVYKGNQSVLTAFGVTMTPDHLVLTTDGWKNASSCEGYNRADCRLPDGHSIFGFRWEKFDMGRTLPMRQNCSAAGLGAEKTKGPGDHGLMWVHAKSQHQPGQHETWNEPTPSVRGVARDARPLPVADTPGVGELRRPWDYSVSRLAGVVRQFLGRYGAWVFEGLNARSTGQRGRVHRQQLRVAVLSGAGDKQANDGAIGHASGHDGADTRGAVLRDQAVDAFLPACARLAPAPGTRAVYDLKDCGPRNRFAVWGSDGKMLIVHNCNQAMGRDVMAANMPAIEAAGYEICLTVHDEIVCEAPGGPKYNAEGLSAILATVPKWAPGLPLAAAGFESLRYKKE